MARVYETLLTKDKDLISGQIFNAGYENQKVIDLAGIVKKVIGNDVKIEIQRSNDNCSYIYLNKIKSLKFFHGKNN